MKVNLSKVVVFTTSAIQEYKGQTLHSTGRLERAVEEGYIPYIVSSRTHLSENDGWWRKLVPDERIFLSSKEEQNEDGGYANSPSMIRPWRKLYEALGITPKGEWDSWFAAQHELADHDVKYSYYGD